MTPSCSPNRSTPRSPYRSLLDSPFEKVRWLAAPGLAVSIALAAGCASRPATRSAPVPPAPIDSTAPASPSLPAVAPKAPTEPASEPAPELSSAPEPPALESAAVAARFPEPPVSYRTPAFAPGHVGFTNNAELSALLHRLVHDGGPGPDSTNVKLVSAGSSQRGVPLEALSFTRLADSTPTGLLADGRPTVLLVGQQHGDEPAGSEALLVIAQELAQGKLRVLLDRINVVILPRANPDGAEAGQRLTASGIDANRDHLLLRSPEAQALAQLVREFAPLVVVDAHEYPVGGRFQQKFGAVPRFDALFQYAMAANLPEFVTKASEEWFRRPLLGALKSAGLTSEWYYTTTSDLDDNKLSMGGPQPDTARNVNGLKNAVSILVETRGVGLGELHLKRRVYTQVTAITSLLQSAVQRAADLTRLRQFIDADVSAKACQGDAVVEAEAISSEYALSMLDPVTGVDKNVTVTWDSTLVLTPRRIRARPCGYWLGAEQVDAVMRLRGLGVQVQRLEEQGAMRGESYREVSRKVGVRSDAGISVADASGVVKVAVETVPVLIDVAVGSYYVGLDQPLANLVLAALEPDTQSSYFANRIIDRLGAEARVMLRPDVRMSPLP